MFDSRSIYVSEVPKREITLTVDREDAIVMAEWLELAMKAVPNPQNPQMRHLYAALKAVADNREFGGH